MWFLRFLALLVCCLGAVGGGTATAQTRGGADAADTPWIVRCEAAESAQEACEMFQRLVIKDSGQRVAEMAVGFPPGQDDGRGVIVLPLGIMLTDSLSLVVDNEKVFRFKVRYCIVEGCFAFLRVNDSLLEALKRGNEAVVKARTLTGQDLDITFSLADFTRTVEEIS